MKKVFAILAIAALASCGGSTESAEAKVDSVVATADSTVSAVVDSAKSAIDSTAAKADSTVKAVVDSLKK